LERFVVAQRRCGSDCRSGKYEGKGRHRLIAKIDMHLDIVDRSVL
jgi:hypothetical protein